MRAKLFVVSPILIGRSAVALFCVLLLSSSAWAQQASGIAGLVRDTSGAVLPGVTVEAASPALIEKVRRVVTDGQGRYGIVGLRPGVYVVTFSLSGFASVRREGVELATGFTATVNAEMKVGELAETLTVTGAAPVVDVQSVRQQTLVSSALLAVLPTGLPSLSTLVTLTPGMTGNPDVGGSAGTFNTQGGAEGLFHGKFGTKVQFDGMRIQNFTSGDSPGYMFNVQAVEEMQMETGGLSAEGSSTGMTMNLVPKEGSNNFTFAVSSTYSNEHTQSSNLTDALRDRGLTTSSQKVINIYDFGTTVGGPIRKDKIWFFAGWRKWGSRRQVAGLFWNATQGTMFYTPDLSRPAQPYEFSRSHLLRLTWQASPKHKVNIFTDIGSNRGDANQRTTIANLAPEAATGRRVWPTGIVQVTWNRVTNKLLLEAGAAAVIFHYPTFRQPGDIGSIDGSIVSRDHISILEQSTNFRYNSAPFSYGTPKTTDRYPMRFSASYVTGSHAVKVGVQNEMAVVNTSVEGNGPDGVSHTFSRGIPISLTQYAFPYFERAREKAELGIYVQDRWSVDRLTMNLGLRFDYVNMYVPAQQLAAGPFVPARDFPAVHKIPEWKDWNPRLGASYDLFGNGQTALKVSLGRYGDLTGSTLTLNNHPVRTSVNQVTRGWTDDNRNYVPDCNLHDFNQNGECGPISDQNFGKNNANATRYADDVMRGTGVRSFLWDFATEMQHELRPGFSVSGGYYRNWSGNFRATDNLAVTPTDYSTYCITAPLDSRLPSGGGYQVCGLYDINPNKFGQVTGLVTQASNFGKQTQVSDFVNISLRARFASGIQIGGGVDTGRTVADRCFVVDSPQELLYCRTVTPFRGQTQVKLNGIYPLPAGFTVSATYQNVPGPDITANYPATTDQIAPSLGRPLAGGVRTATVPLIEPRTQFEKSRTQLDLRLSKNFNLSPRVRLQANVAAYNALNANSILQRNNAFGQQWGRPQLILDARLIQFSGQLTF